MRPRRMLRFFEEQTRHEALSPRETSGHPLVRAGRAVVVVLHRRSRIGDVIAVARLMLADLETQELMDRVERLAILRCDPHAAA